MIILVFMARRIWGLIQDGQSSPRVACADLPGDVRRHQQIAGPIRLISVILGTIQGAPMKPTIDKTSFGSITVEGESYDHDIFITLEGEVKKRKKKLSKAIYGTSHTISPDEIKYTCQGKPEGIIVGSGQHGIARLSGEAAEFLKSQNCQVILKRTPEAIKEWNNLAGKWIGLFHITC
jgi:hypothetical protein